MQKIRSKTMSILIATLLISTIGASMLLIPTANAHTPAWQIPTWAFVQPVIDPVGVGQSTYIYMWIDKVFGTDTTLMNDWRFHNYKLTITLPDGTAETKTWDTIWDTTSSQGYSYVPTMVGEYKLKFEFPGQAYNTYSHNPNSAYVNDTFLASSAEATLTVQEDPIPTLGSYPLPEEYWTRPIYGENTDSWQIASDWLGSGSPMFVNTKNRVYVPDGVGPLTPHIMWTKPIDTGGVVGGDHFVIQSDTYFDGSAYINRFVNPIILAGKLYYVSPRGFVSAYDGPTKCVDLRTGEVIWSVEGMPRLSFGYIEAIHNPQQHGVAQPMLVATSGTTWMVYDGDTGVSMFNFTSVPRGAAAMGTNGEYMQYILYNQGTSSSPDYILREWNSSLVFFQYNGGIRPARSGEFDVGTPEYYNWNVSIPWRNTMTSNPTVVAAWYDDMMLCYNGSLPNSGFTGFGGNPVRQDPYTYFAVNLNASKGAVGSMLWMKTYTPAIANITVIPGGSDPVLGIFVEKMKETNQWVAYNLRTGDKMWGPVGDQPGLDYYGNPGHEQVFTFIAYGKVYASGYGGVIFCYDGLTGDLLWSYGNGGPGNSTNSGFAVPGHYPTSINAIANGVLYTVTTEHTIQTPIYKGALCRAINATTGEEIWTLSSNVAEFNNMNYALADGFAAWFNSYDNQIYSVGRGPSAMTVSASPKVTMLCNSVLVEGTVIDTAAGTKQNEQSARFPNGVPAVADESMSDWMRYVYMQGPRPIDAMGVPVAISVVDANGNYREIGSTTSDADGFFSFSWVPDIEGKYTVYASFGGSEAYWPSHAVTAFAVDPAAATPVPTEAPAQSMSDMYFVPAVAGIIVAIVACFAITILVLRKRP
jgi:hypothetical protein